MRYALYLIVAFLSMTNSALADGGLSLEERKVFYHHEEGSEIIPLALLKPLYRANTNALFLDNLERFGLIKDSATQGADQLPIGVTSAPTRDLRAIVGTKLTMVGINCAACHVNAITFQGQTLIIDGAPNRFDIENFFQELASSVLYTLNPANGKLLEYLKNISQNPRNTFITNSRLFLSMGMSDAIKNEAREKLDDDIIKFIEEFAQNEALAPLPDAESFYNDFKLSKSPPVLKLSEIDSKKLDILSDRFKNEPFSLRGISVINAKSNIFDTLKEIKVAISLLRARVVFLMNLGAGGTTTPGLHGRTDAFGHARVFMFESEKNFKSLAPVDYPSLWGFADRTWMHWDGNTNSVLERNFGQALGLGAVFSKNDHSSTVSLKSLNKLEVLARKIKSPAWPSEIFGDLNADRITRGMSLFLANCASCHVNIEPPGGFMFSPLDEIKTDPNHASQFAQPLDKNGPAFAAALADVLGKLKLKAQKDENISDTELDSWEYGRKSQWRSTRAYMARPLQGIWASAPYLHNGSVPTLYDLLSAVEDRPKSFQVGQREFDPVFVGYIKVSPGTPNTKTLNTNAPGNSNSGHVYGSALTHEEKLDLIEYLKSL